MTYIKILRLMLRMTDYKVLVVTAYYKLLRIDMIKGSLLVTQTAFVII